MSRHLDPIYVEWLQEELTSLREAHRKLYGQWLATRGLDRLLAEAREDARFWNAEATRLQEELDALKEKK